MRHAFRETERLHVPDGVGPRGEPERWDEHSIATCQACGLEVRAVVILMSDPEKPWDGSWPMVDYDGSAAKSGRPECPEDLAAAYAVMSS